LDCAPLAGRDREGGRPAGRRADARISDPSGMTAGTLTAALALAFVAAVPVGMF
jgi:hypothetical protein